RRWTRSAACAASLPPSSGACSGHTGPHARSRVPCAERKRLSATSATQDRPPQVGKGGCCYFTISTEWSLQQERRARLYDAGSLVCKKKTTIGQQKIAHSGRRAAEHGRRHGAHSADLAR